VGDGRQGELKLFSPAKTGDLLRGWQLHVGRRRDMHERAGRRAQQWHYIVGSAATVMAAFAGSSLVSTWNADERSNGLALAGGVIGAAAAVLVAFQTFLDLGARAERHRQSAVEYKALLRRFERLTERRSADSPCGVADDEAFCRAIEELEAELHRVDSRAPVVPVRLAAKVERRTLGYYSTAEALAAAGTPSKRRPPPPPSDAEAEADGDGDDDAPAKPTPRAPKKT